MKTGNRLSILLSMIITTVLGIQQAQAEITQCSLDDSSSYISCAGSPYYGGYIKIKNTAKDQTTIYVYPVGASTLALKPNDESGLIYMVAAMRANCFNCTAKNIAVTIVKQCTTQPTVAEIHNSTCS